MVWKALGERLRSRPRPPGVKAPPKVPASAPPGKAKALSSASAPPGKAKATSLASGPPAKAKVPTKAMPRAATVAAGPASGMSIPGVTAPKSRGPVNPSQAKYEKQLQVWQKEAESKRRRILAEHASASSKAGSKAPTTPPKASASSGRVWSQEESDSWGAWTAPTGAPEPENPAGEPVDPARDGEEGETRLAKARRMVNEAREKTRRLWLETNPAPPPPPLPP